jgi:hypothetical protein
MTDDLTSLASAYLDGELDADGRAQVEASPDALSEVDRLRQVRAVLADLPSPPISARERHLAEALDAWDRLPEAERMGSLRDVTPSGADGAAAAGVAAISAPARSSSRRSRRRGFQSSVWLGAAAAGLVVVLAGGLLLRSFNDTESDSDASSSELLSDESAEVQAPAATEAPAAAGDALDQSEGESAGDPAGAVPQIDTGIDNAAPPADDGELPVLAGADDLAAFAASAVGAPESGDLPEDATVVTELSEAERSEISVLADELDLPRCPSVDVIVGLAIYDGQEVVVGVDESRALALAYLPDGCVRVASAPMP